MRPPLDHTTRSWAEGHEAAMRKAAADAIAASNRWRALNAALTEKWRREGRDDLAVSQMKAANLALSDEYGTFSFFAGKAQMHAAVLQGALAARVLLADDDPSGLRYSRDDEPPAAPVPPGVDGLSLTGRPLRRPTNSPAGHAFPETRAHSVGRPGTQQPPAPAEGSGAGGEGVAGLRGPATPTPAGGAAWV